VGEEGRREAVLNEIPLRMLVKEEEKARNRKPPTRKKEGGRRHLWGETSSGRGWKPSKGVKDGVPLFMGEREKRAGAEGEGKVIKSDPSGKRGITT